MVNFFLRSSLFILGCALAASAIAQPYPSRPVRLIVPIAPGSVTDVILRAAARELSARLGQTVVVDNRTGGGGVIGGELCARAAPDGYTVCAIYTATTSTNPHLFDKLPYDPAKDFAPITHLYYVTGALVVPASLPVRSVDELRALAAAKPRAVNFGTIGPGSYPEIFLAWLNDHWKVNLTGVPYKGGAPVASALVSGEIQASAVGLGNLVGQLQGGQLRALAVSGSKRSKLFPNVPTMAETGLGAFQGHLWWGLAAPAGTPKPIVAKLNAEIVKLFREPKFVELMESQAVEPVLGTPETFAAFMKSDREWSARLVKK